MIPLTNGTRALHRGPRFQCLRVPPEPQKSFVVFFLGEMKNWLFRQQRKALEGKLPAEHEVSLNHDDP